MLPEVGRVEYLLGAGGDIVDDLHRCAPFVTDVRKAAGSFFEHHDAARQIAARYPTGCTTETIEAIGQGAYGHATPVHPDQRPGFALPDGLVALTGD